MKRNLRFFIALWFCKAFNCLMQIFLHRRSVHKIGVIAHAICPDMLGRFERPDKVIMVTGTNGKTTTTNMLHDFLQKKGLRLITNLRGANVYAGIITAFFDGTSLTGRNKADMAVLEIDERSAESFFTYLHPDYLLITNLFQDSDKCNGTVSFIRDILEDSIPPESILIVNGDDVISSLICENTNKRIVYSFPRQEGEKSNIQSKIQDIRLCPRCHKPLTFDFIRYHHIGAVHCENCGFTNLKPDIYVSAVHAQEDTFSVTADGKEETYPLIGKGIVNIYNELLLLTILRELGYKKEEIAPVLPELHVLTSRFEELDVGALHFTFQCAKGMNPIAVSRALDYSVHASGNSGKKMIIVNNLEVNSMFGNGKENKTYTNPAWIWDADFEYLNRPDVEVVIGGKFRNDMLVRLLYAGIPQERLHVVPDLADLSRVLDFSDVDHVFYLSDWDTKYFGDKLLSDLQSQEKKRQSKNEAEIKHQPGSEANA